MPKKRKASAKPKASKLPAVTVQAQKKSAEPVSKSATTDMLKVERPHGKIVLPSKAGVASSAIDQVPENDPFLSRVESKKAVTESTEEKKPSVLKRMLGTKKNEEQNDVDKPVSTGGALGEVEKKAEKSLGSAPVKDQPRGRILSPSEKAASATPSEKAERLAKDARDMKEEMRTHEKEVAAKEEEKEAGKKDKKKVPQQYQKQGELKRLLGTIGHIGLGKERMRFIENLAMMLNAGLPLVDSLKTLQLETRVKPMKKLLQRILDSVENGSPLWRAMEKENFFSLQALALVRIGEEAGNLAENIAYLAQQEQKDHELKSKVKMAMIYPSIVLTIMLIIIVGLGMFVLPNLIGVLYSLNVELPLVTRIVIGFSNIFTQYGAIIVPGMIVAGILLVILAKFTPLRRVTQWVMFRIPGIGGLAREATIARFGVILGGLLKAGVPVVEAMDSLVQVTPIVAYRNLYSKMKEHIVVGDSFSKSFESIKGSQKLLPPSVQQLVITGERSGALADIMLKIADIYDKKASETAQKLPVILEPMLLLFIGAMVGTIAFAIIVPIYSIVGNVGRA